MALYCVNLPDDVSSGIRAKSKARSTVLIDDEKRKANK